MIYVITGATGTGKTSLALKFAKQVDGHLVNSDASQIYQHLNIGTNKSSPQILNEYQHHLINIVEPNQSYDVANYQKDARAIIKQYAYSNHPLIFVGGTGLYLKATFYDYEFFSEKKVNNEQFDHLSNEQLHQLLISMSPSEASLVHVNNRQRLIRYLVRVSNLKTQKIDITRKKDHLLYENVTFLAINVDRQTLYQKVNQRVLDMIDQGLIEEVEHLFNKYGHHHQAFQAIGYKQMVNHLINQEPLAVTIKKIQQATRNYIKRQMTYLKHQLPINWFDNEAQAYDFLIQYYQKHHQK